MNVDQLIKRAEKLIKQRKARENAPSIHFSDDGLFPQDFNGLVVIYDLPDTHPQDSPTEHHP